MKIIEIKRCRELGYTIFRLELMVRIENIFIPPGFQHIQYAGSNYNNLQLRIRDAHIRYVDMFLDYLASIEEHKVRELAEIDLELGKIDDSYIEV